MRSTNLTTIFLLSFSVKIFSSHTMSVWVMASHPKAIRVCSFHQINWRQLNGPLHIAGWSVVSMLPRTQEKSVERNLKCNLQCWLLVGHYYMYLHMHALMLRCMLYIGTLDSVYYFIYSQQSNDPVQLPQCHIFMGGCSWWERWEDENNGPIAAAWGTFISWHLITHSLAC